MLLSTIAAVLFAATGFASATPHSACTSVFAGHTAGPCADICTDPPPSCRDDPDLCCCIPETVMVPCPTSTTSAEYTAVVIATPIPLVERCADACPDPAPPCSQAPNLCCCIRGE